MAPTGRERTYFGKRLFRFWRAEFDEAQSQLSIEGVPVPVDARSLHLLQIFLERPGEVIGKEELLTEVWRGIAVEEGSLATSIWKLRQALGREGRDLIKSVPGQGYKFLSEVLIRDAKTSLAKSSTSNISNSARIAARKKTRRSSESLRVQSFLVTTPLFHGTESLNADLVALTLKLPAKIHNQIPRVGQLVQELPGWLPGPKLDTEGFLNHLATRDNIVSSELRAAIVAALDDEAGALHFSKPKALTSDDISRFVDNLLTFHRKGPRQAFVGALILSGCIVLVQVSWGAGQGLKVVTEYAVTEIGEAMIDRVVIAMKNHNVNP